uniref:Ribosomal protein L7/12 n=1 Tax=Gloeochaete wittrockiana TaxID=38269 RepID=A0A3G1IVX1_9EUKA|nr:ribosomal protein L7/L12 [Gloeochaete wittrockiana]YP_009546112.1 ribosomal protein L7/12 [Gloeochaete wittrockiana]ASQ40124.1 ribosomal protein L7/L12 [Gloeochaete wittrockiana]ASQ40173.1 ribosomal protein L7/12 [Gloeochaete wittrockiana]
MTSTATEEILEQLKKLTLIEATQLVKQIEETFGVDATVSGGAFVMPTSSSAPSAEPVEEKTQFDLILEEVPSDKKIAILKVVRSLTELGLKEAKELVESAPKAVKQGISKEEVEEAKKQLEEAGAKVTIK